MHAAVKPKETLTSTTTARNTSLVDREIVRQDWTKGTPELNFEHHWNRNLKSLKTLTSKINQICKYILVYILVVTVDGHIGMVLRYCHKHMMYVIWPFVLCYEKKSFPCDSRGACAVLMLLSRCQQGGYSVQALDWIMSFKLQKHCIA